MALLKLNNWSDRGTAAASPAHRLRQRRMTTPSEGMKYFVTPIHVGIAIIKAAITQANQRGDGGFIDPFRSRSPEPQGTSRKNQCSATSNKKWRQNRIRRVFHLSTKSILPRMIIATWGWVSKPPSCPRPKDCCRDFDELPDYLKEESIFILCYQFSSILWLH